MDQDLPPRKKRGISYDERSSTDDSLEGLPSYSEVMTSIYREETSGEVYWVKFLWESGHTRICRSWDKLQEPGDIKKKVSSWFNSAHNPSQLQAYFLTSLRKAVMNLGSGCWFNGRGKQFFFFFLSLLTSEVDATHKNEIWVSTSTTDHEDCWSTVWAHDGNEQHDSVHVSSITDGYIKEGDIFKVVLEIKSRTASTGLQQLENSIFGLWKQGQKAMIAILCVDGKTTIYVYKHQDEINEASSSSSHKILQYSVSRTIDLGDFSSASYGIFGSIFLHAFRRHSF